MKIEVNQQFNPITITLETQDEVNQMLAIVKSVLVDTEDAIDSVIYEAIEFVAEPSAYKRVSLNDYSGTGVTKIVPNN